MLWGHEQSCCNRERLKGRWRTTKRAGLVEGGDVGLIIMFCPNCKAQHEKELKTCPSCGYNRFTKIFDRPKPSFWKYVVIPLLIYFSVCNVWPSLMGGKLNTYGLGCFGFMMLVVIYALAYMRSLGVKFGQGKGKGSSSDNFHYFN